MANHHMLPPVHRGAAGGLRVGIAGSLSGARTAHAEAFRAAHEHLAQRGISACLGDDASDPHRALALGAEFAREGVTLVIGHFNSACARAVMPFYRAQGIELLLPASTDVDLALGDGAYRLCANDTAQAETIHGWIARRFGHAIELEVRTDGSDYAARLLACLRRPAQTVVRDVADPATPRAPVCVVLAVAQQALEFIATPPFHGSSTTMIFSDEAAVDAVRTAAARSETECWLVTPEPSYEALLARGCELVHAWQQRGQPSECFGAWAIAEHFILPSGEAVGAHWALRRCARTFASAAVSAPELPTVLPNATEIN